MPCHAWVAGTDLSVRYTADHAAPIPALRPSADRNPRLQPVTHALPVFSARHHVDSMGGMESQGHGIEALLPCHSVQLRALPTATVGAAATARPAVCTIEQECRHKIAGV